MIKNILTALLIICCGLAGQAQNKFVSLPLTSEKIKTYAYASNDRLVYFIRDKEIMHVLVYDTAYGLLKQTKYSLEDFIDRSEGVIAVTEVNHMPALFFADKKLTTFSSIALDLNTYDILQSTYPKLAAKNYYLNSFSANGSFYILCFDDTEEKSVLVLKKYTGGNTSADHRISIADIPVNLGYEDWLYKLFFGPEITSQGSEDVSALKRINTGEPNDNISAAASTKLYIGGNSMVITMNNIADTTQVLEIDLTTYAKTFRKLPLQSTLCTKDRKATGNSFLIDNNLFFAAACKDYLVTKVLDFKTGNTLKEFVTSKDGAVSYKNGPYYKSANKKITHPELETKQLLNKLCEYGSDARFGIGVTVAENSDYDVYIGNSKEIVANGFFVGPAFFMFPPTNFMPGAGFGGMHALILSTAFTSSFAPQAIAAENVYFKTCFTATGLLHVAKSDEPAFYDKLNEKTGQLDDDEYIKGINKIRFRGKLILSYVNTGAFTGQNNFFMQVFNGN